MMEFIIDNVCFKKTGTKRSSNTLLYFVPAVLKQTLIGNRKPDNSSNLNFSPSLLAIHLGTRKASKKYTFGLYRAEVIGALITVLIIWFVTGVLLYLACQRLVSGDFQVDPNPMIAVASCAVIFNIILGLLLNGQHHGHRCVFVCSSNLFLVKTNVFLIH